MKSAKVELKPDPTNPNRMDPSDKKRMARSLDEFGDLSGVILNRRTGLLVGGHQRVDVLAELGEKQSDFQHGPIGLRLPARADSFHMDEDAQKARRRPVPYEPVGRG